MDTKLIAVFAIIMFLSACGGSSNTDETLGFEIPELRITQLAIADIDSDTEHTIEFDPDVTSLYEVDIDNGTDSVDIYFNISCDAVNGSVFYLVNGSFEDEIERLETPVTVGGAESTDTSSECDETAANAEDRFWFLLSLELEEGSNYIKLFVDAGDDISFITYDLNLYRINSTADLSSLALFEFPSGTSADGDLSPTFESDVYTYELTVPYSTCSLAAVPETESSASTFTYLDEEFETGDSIFTYLEPGRNFVDLFVDSEDGERRNRYEIEINRTDPDDEDRLANANLRSIEMEGTDLEFNCGVTDYAIFVDANVGSTILSLETEVDGALVSINGVEVDPEESYPIDIDSSFQTTTILVESADGTDSIEYNVEIFRRSNNYVYVETVEELASALRNAAPNDFIEIEEGDYDISTLPDDVLVDGTLATDRSGSALQPVIVTVVTEDETNIFGDSDSGAPLLSFSGAHWEISGLNISDAAYGVELDGAENIMLSEIEFYDISGSAIIEENGNSNMVRLSRFENIGSDQADTHIIDITSSSGSDIRQNTFVMNENNSAIVVDAASEDTIIESNNFTHEDDLAALNHNVISSQADNTTVFYNVFEFGIRSINQALISFGENTEVEDGVFVYENRVEDIDSDSAIPFIESSITPTFVHLPDHTPEAVTVTGAGITDYIQPSYNIVMEDDPDFCFSLYQDEDVDYDSDTEEFFLGIEECNGSDEQTWSIEVGESAPYVKFKNESIDTDYAYLTTLGNFSSFCGLSEVLPSVYLDEDFGGFGQRWLLKKDNYDLTIASQILQDYSLMLADTQPDDGDGFSVCPYVSSSAQMFNLVPQ